MTEKFDAVNHPSHYTCYEHEVIELTEKLDFCLGNAVKYILRADHKGPKAEDLKKAAWYLTRISFRGGNRNMFEGLLPDPEDDESYVIEELVESFCNPTLLDLMDAIACEDEEAFDAVICDLYKEAEKCEAEERYQKRISELEKENARLLSELEAQKAPLTPYRFDPQRDANGEYVYTSFGVTDSRIPATASYVLEVL